MKKRAGPLRRIGGGPALRVRPARSADRSLGEADVGIILGNEQPGIDTASTVPRGVNQKVGSVVGSGFEGLPKASADQPVLVISADDDTLATAFTDEPE